MKPLLALVLLAAGLVVSGCTQDESSVDLDRGRQLFAANCAGCHVLAQAGSTGQLGPDLDAAFEAAREAGMDANTIHGVVARQIAFPRPASTDDSYVFMPANIVTGQDAQDVAAYVASVAGVPGIEPPKVPGPPGAQIFFDNGCAGCHTLSVVGAAGTTGPNLDDAVPDLSESDLETAIRQPDAEIAPGFPAGVMPAYTSLTDEELKELIQFLLDCAGPNPDSSCTEMPSS